MFKAVALTSATLRVQPLPNVGNVLKDSRNCKRFVEYKSMILLGSDDAFLTKA
jgi:hypothetical protein